MLLSEEEEDALRALTLEPLLLPASFKPNAVCCRLLMWELVKMSYVPTTSTKTIRLTPAGMQALGMKLQ